MKQAKATFDDIVSRARDGEDVPFGEMEHALAEAFLRRYLENLFSDSEATRANAYYREQMTDYSNEGYDEEGEPFAMDSNQLLQYRLTAARTAIGALGVRPSITDFSKLIDDCVRSSNWGTLENLLSLTEERKLPDGTVERAALHLIGYELEYSLGELRKHFPDLEYSEEDVQAEYQNVVNRGVLTSLTSAIEALKNETGILPKAELVQTAYRGIEERQLNKHNEDNLVPLIEELCKLTGQKPVIDHQAKKFLKDYFAQADSDYETTISLAGLYGIFQDPAVSKMAQASTLIAGKVDTFIGLYTEARNVEEHNALSPRTSDTPGLRLSDDAVRKLLKKYYSDTDQVENVCKCLSIDPPEEMMQDIYAKKLLSRDGIDDLYISFCNGDFKVVPRISEEIVQNKLARLRKIDGSDFRTISIFFDILTLSDYQGDDAQLALQYFGREDNPVLKAVSRPMDFQEVTESFLARLFAGNYTAEQLGELCFDNQDGIGYHMMASGVQPTERIINYAKNINVVRETINLVSRINKTIEDNNKIYCGDHKKINPLNPRPRFNIPEYRAVRKEIKEAANEQIKYLRKLRQEDSNLGFVEHKAHNALQRQCLDLLLVQYERDEKKGIVHFSELVGATGLSVSDGLVGSSLRDYIERRYDSVQAHTSAYKKLTSKMKDKLEQDPIISPYLKQDRSFDGLCNNILDSRYSKEGLQVANELRFLLDISGRSNFSQKLRCQIREVANRIGDIGGYYQSTDYTMKNSLNGLLREMN